LNSIKEKGLKFWFVSSPEYRDGPFATRSGKTSDARKAMSSLDDYDLVIADTVTWPLRIHTRVIFIGQFTWEHYYEKCLKLPLHQQTDVVDYLSMSLAIFGMEAFTWPEIRKLRNYTPLPILDYWALRDLRIPKVESLGTIASAIRNPQIEFLQSKLNLARIDAPEEYFSRGELCPIGIFCRPGLGAISETLSLRSVPILLRSDDFELSENCRVVMERRWGIVLDNQKMPDYQALLKDVTIMRESINFPDTITSNELAQMILDSKD
jgi:hypothetical protein